MAVRAKSEEIRLQGPDTHTTRSAQRTTPLSWREARANVPRGETRRPEHEDPHKVPTTLETGPFDLVPSYKQREGFRHFPADTPGMSVHCPIHLANVQL